jgi:TRAP transporter TAXI family solute receptor
MMGKPHITPKFYRKQGAWPRSGGTSLKGPAAEPLRVRGIGLFFESERRARFVMKKPFLIGTLILGMVALGFSQAEAGTRFATIGTGGLTGVYYPTGGAISRMVNEKRKEYNLRVTVESTGGSVFNVNALMNGDLEFGIVQSDLQYQAIKGLKQWKGRPQEKLRSVFSIHSETVSIVAAAESGIKSVADLKGKVVNIGNPGSGQRGNSIDLLRAAGIDYKKDLRAEGLKAAESASMLKDGRIDAFFYTVGHPNGALKEAVAGSHGIMFVPVDKKIVDKLTSRFPFYAPAVIPLKFYPGVQNDVDVQTFGMKATLCTSTGVPEDIVYYVVKEVFENLETFKELHPAYSVLTKEGMLQGLSAPLHPGAEKYFREVGLLK